MLRLFSAGGVVYNPTDNRILIIKPTGRDTWQLPKGLLDKGEKSTDAAVREVREETGCTAEVEQKIEAISYYYADPKSKERIFKTTTFFLMRYIDGDITKHDWEIEKVEWVGKEVAQAKLTYDNEKKIVSKAFELWED